MRCKHVTFPGKFLEEMLENKSGLKESETNYLRPGVTHCGSALVD